MPEGDPQPGEIWLYRRGLYEEVTIIKVDDPITDHEYVSHHDMRYPRVTAKKKDGRKFSWATIHFVDIFIYKRQADDSGGGSSSSSTAQSDSDVKIGETFTEQQQIADAQQAAEKADEVIDLTGDSDDEAKASTKKKGKKRKRKLLEEFKLRF